MMSNALVLAMYELIESINLDKTQHQTTIEEYEHKATNSAREITNLSSKIPSLSYFKVGFCSRLQIRSVKADTSEVHPFTPFPMMICIKFLLSRKTVNDRARVQASEVWTELQSISSVNNLARICLSKLQNLDQMFGTIRYDTHVEAP
jgi:hypothetical protein